MFVLPADRAHFKALKRDLREKLPGLSSSAADEALAAAAGFRTYAALTASGDRPWIFREKPFLKRLSDLKVPYQDEWSGWSDFVSTDGLVLGFHPDHLLSFRSIPCVGGVFVAGTTGSGRSTTVEFLMRDYVARSRKKLKTITFEDPKGYPLPLVSDVEPPPIHPDGIHVITGETGRGRSRSIQAALRGDPDAMVLGELRDAQTGEHARIAIQSGTLVIAPIHAISALGVVERLTDFGVSRSVLASFEFIQLLVYQTRLPVLCPICSKPLDQTVPGALRAWLSDNLKKSEIDRVRMRGDGCAVCRSSGCPVPGVIGRTVCADVLAPTPEMRALFRSNDLAARRRLRGSGPLDFSSSSCGPEAINHAVWKMVRGLIDPTDIEARFGRPDLQKAC